MKNDYFKTNIFIKALNLFIFLDTKKHLKMICFQIWELMIWLKVINMENCI